MGDPRALCLLCRARQLVQVAARRGALVSSSSSSSSSRSTDSWTPSRGRWHATITGDAPSTAGASTGGNAVGGGSDPWADARRTPHILNAISTPHEMRKKRSKRSNDAALAVFQDIVESGRQQEDQPVRRIQKNPGKAGAKGKGEGEENHDWTRLEQITRLQTHQAQAEQTSHGRLLPVNEEIYGDLIKLVQMGSQPDMRVTEVFAFFESALYPHLVEMAEQLPAIFRQTSERMMHDVTAAKQRDLLCPDLPSVARITEIRRQLGLLSTPRTWLALVLELSEKILALEQDHLDAEEELAAREGAEALKGDEDAVDGRTSRKTAEENPITASQRERLISELIEAWRIFILPDILISNPKALALAGPREFRMPTPDPFLMAKYANEGKPDIAIASLFPRYAPQQLQGALPAVLATYAILIDPAICTLEARQQAREFTTSVKSILEALSLDRRAVARIFGEHQSLARYMVDRWPLDGSENSYKMNRATRLKRAKWALNFKSIHGQVGNALRTRNLQACDAAWERFWAAISSPDYQGAVRMRRGESLFDYFIMVYTTMRMPDRAIAVWNLMSTVGVEPTLRTWTSFMEGCKLSSNPQGIHSIWEKLMASGIEVDTAAWTARISGLIQSGEIEAGIQALKEMQRTWEASVADPSKKAKAVKVTIEPVNAAIAGVLRAGDMQAARKVLAWGGQHGIEPNVTTFNTILRPLVRDGRADEAAGLLDMMRQRGIEPDEATVTILLDGTLGSGAMEGRSSAEQTEIVKQVLAEVEAAGLDANQMTYGKIIYLLLEGGIRTSEHKVAYSNRNPSEHNRNHGQQLSANDRADEAVHVVLDRMRQRSIALSPHIYTILAEHYFSLNPPDLEAVKCLIETGQPLRSRAKPVAEQPAAQTAETAEQPTEQPAEQRTEPHALDAENGEEEAAAAAAAVAAEEEEDIGTSINTSIFDRVFWERVVRGFAQIGDTKSALKYFKHIEDSLSLTSSTLEDLLRALLKNGEWEAATQLVTKVRAQKMLVVQSVDAARGRGEDQPRMFRHRFWHLAAQHGLL